MTIQLIQSTQETPTPTVRAAESIAKSTKQTIETIIRNRQTACSTLWGFKTTNKITGEHLVQRISTPDNIINELSEGDQVKLMFGDIAARILLSLRQEDIITAFATSSPVPAGETVNFKDSFGSLVDLTPELIALLTKMSSVKSVEITTI